VSLANKLVINVYVSSSSFASLTLGLAVSISDTHSFKPYRSTFNTVLSLVHIGLSCLMKGKLLRKTVIVDCNKHFIVVEYSVSLQH